MLLFNVNNLYGLVYGPLLSEDSHQPRQMLTFYNYSNLYATSMIPVYYNNEIIIQANHQGNMRLQFSKAMAKLWKKYNN